MAQSGVSTVRYSSDARVGAGGHVCLGRPTVVAEPVKVLSPVTDVVRSVVKARAPLAYVVTLIFPCASVSSAWTVDHVCR